ncbi:MAG: valine--tRNA ligase [Candidatus Aenigmarchaeota archaeon CG_4_10_14_0_8_um_filter_37_24]|nr:valine--tRNA ligase [Candidatus Aenigmarchaeota archaeon]OIN85461.1 MAG: valine--tRNA ligase [Candidatus Aenigmarchaeota archaeon CG1_02_38_14]PIY36030.1 MAG: valine--tRNA ligase [Candidatus Aenigmarchaeota archaeon CG_4_10_14_3_um_filter_37_21]PIZ35884.1 MAG: valine--tRNA ligase [Candidatus Aenigmarchaeota archaeon CG_4_10_14_0_8_um_filter_37_24]PJB75924.1 MAG: valine--tRNA ligase [Candidatus Aenigmarchaeota archaeon CG_4_9_14_3_um_filter_37_18]
MEFKPKITQNRWDKSLEKGIWDKWQREGLFKFDKNSKKPLFAIDIPPPYVNTPIHVGHAYTYVWQDIMARSKRMLGYNVLFPMGLDKNGLPIEVQAEKTYGINMHKTPREEFIKLCKEMIEKSGDASLDSFKRLGLSCNQWDVKYELSGRYDTDDPEYRKLTQETFIDLWKKGLIYEDLKPTNYCSVCGTAIADAEVEYKDGSTALNHVKFRVKETAEDIIIATTRPELLCTCKIILYNPEDQRYKHLKNKTAIVPVFGQEVKIMPHPAAKIEFGSGLVMICSFGDFTDIRTLRELGLESSYAIDIYGKMTDVAGSYAGMKVKEARDKIIEDLKKQELIIKQETVQQRSPICWRSKTPIEFVALKEFYLKQVDYVDELKKTSDKMKFFAPESRQILLDWINSVSIDWVLSRRRYYGTEVPLWYCKKCDYIHVPEKGKYYQPWLEPCPEKKCPKCGSTEWTGETRTFDTWFDSSSSNAYVMGYLWDKEFFKKHMPCSMRPQGKEIVRTWLYYTLVKSFHLYGIPPFKDCWIHMHIVDEKGTKMSKSLGNVIDPHEILEKYGAEAFRIWSCLEGNITKGDIRCSFERIEGNSKFLTKLWNVARLISMFPQAEGKVELLEADKWILDELNLLVGRCRANYEAYEFSMIAEDIRNFVWNVFASHYVEMVKTRAYGEGGFGKEEQKAAWFTLHEVMKNILKILSPITPFVADYIWLELYSKESICKESYPELKWKNGMEKLTGKLMEFNSMVWKTKKDQGLSMKDQIKVAIPAELKVFEKDLARMHGIC